MKKYKPEIEQEMKAFFATLSEKDKRHYAVVEARKLGHGGQRYVAQLLGCSTRTIQRGIGELKAKVRLPQGRIRRQGGGRKLFDQKKNV